MERLYNEWARVLDAQATRLEVEASPLVGQAGFGWGWRRTSASTVEMRTEGALDLLALSLELRLSGELVDGSARSRIRVHCKGRSELRMTIAQLGEQAAEGQDLKAVQRTWRFPFTLEIEPLAGAEPATLSAAAGAGADHRRAGRRMRAAAARRCCRTAVVLRLARRARDRSSPRRPTRCSAARARRASILPALALVDWSAG